MEPKGLLRHKRMVNEEVPRAVRERVVARSLNPELFAAIGEEVSDGREYVVRVFPIEGPLFRTGDSLPVYERVALILLRDPADAEVGECVPEDAFGLWEGRPPQFPFPKMSPEEKREHAERVNLVETEWDPEKVMINGEEIRLWKRVR